MCAAWVLRVAVAVDVQAGVHRHRCMTPGPGEQWGQWHSGDDSAGTKGTRQALWVQSAIYQQQGRGLML